MRKRKMYLSVEDIAELFSFRSGEAYCGIVVKNSNLLESVLECMLEERSIHLQR